MSRNEKSYVKQCQVISLNVFFRYDIIRMRKKGIQKNSCEKHPFGNAPASAGAVFYALCFGRGFIFLLIKDNPYPASDILCEGFSEKFTQQKGIEHELR